MRENDMVCSDGPPMKLATIGPDGVAECIFIDTHGIPRLRFVHIDALKPMWMKMQPRTCWSETRNIDLFEVQEEEQRAAETRRLERRAARKAKRSNKIKRRTSVAA